MLAAGLGWAQTPRNGDPSRKDMPSRSAVVSAETKHLTVRATLSAPEVAPGARVSVAADIIPKAGMHVYAPGGKYIPVTLRIEPRPFLKAHDVLYPPATDYFFAPLKELARVYSGRFRLVLDVTVADDGVSSAIPSRLPLTAAIDYQACDDTVCYLPASVPLQWTVKVTR